MTPAPVPDQDRQANMFLQAAITRVDNMVRMTRSLINALELPIGTSSGHNIVWHGYSPSNPAMVQTYVTILRTANNFVHVSEEDGKPPTSCERTSAFAERVDSAGQGFSEDAPAGIVTCEWKASGKRMSLEVKLWKIDSDQPEAVPRERLNLEDRLEDWLCKDIALLSEDLLVIGRQIHQYGGTLDLLAIDREGNLVVIELKRDKTPRDVVAQALDYASWVEGFGLEDLERYTQEHLGNSFVDAFVEAFGQEPPEVVNERHRLFIVASSLDAATQRIIEYQSTTHDVDINAATFAYFNTDGGEFVARSMLLDEEDVERRARRASKRAPARSEEELRAIAEAHGVADLWDVAIGGFGRVARKGRSRTTLFF